MITLHRTWCDFVGLPDQLSLSIRPNPATGLAEPMKSLVYDVAPEAVCSSHVNDWYAYATQQNTTVQHRLCTVLADMYNVAYLREALKGDVGYFRKQYPTTYEWRFHQAQLWFPVPEPGEFPGLTFNGASLAIAARLARWPMKDDSSGTASLAFEQGLCPKCGEKGRYLHCTAVCSTHGPYT